MKTLVIYKSLSGFTKKYAEWIAEELLADLVKQKEVDLNSFKDYDVIIYGGALQAVGINGVKKIKSKLEELQDKTVVVFAVGAAPKNDGLIEEITNKNFPNELAESVDKVFYLRGGFDKRKLPFFYKLIMALFVKKLKKKKEKSEDDQGMIEAWDKPVDFTDKEKIEPLVNFVKTA